MSSEEPPIVEFAAGTSGVPSTSGRPQVPDHELIRQIGRGSYGEVWLARNIMGSYRAVKVVYRRDFADDQPYEREFRGLKRFEPISRSHDGFVDILQIGRNDTDGYFYCVMELADAEGNEAAEVDPATYVPKTMAVFVSRRQPLPFRECIAFGLAASAALETLHAGGLVHRDIKPSNLLVVGGMPKLADVGMVAPIGGASIAGGTVGYLAPEGTPSPQADVYSLGKVLYELSTGLDRLCHPALPDFWSTAPELEQLIELNEVVLKACDPNPFRRHCSGEELHEELLLLKLDKSVRRLRLLERFVAGLKRAAVFVLIAIVLSGYEVYRLYSSRERERRGVADAHAATGARLATQGDLLGALPWYAEALTLDEKHPERAARHRMNIGTILQYSPHPAAMLFEKSEVLDIAWSPDGQQIAVALEDGRVAVHNVATGQTAYELVAHAGGVSAIAWHRDGKQLVTVGRDEALKIWNLVTKKVEVTLKEPGKPSSVAWFRKGNGVITAGEFVTPACPNPKPGFVRVSEFIEGIPGARSRILELDESIRTIALTPSGDAFVCGGNDGMARTFSLDALSPVTPPMPHPPKAGAPSWVYSVEVSPSGNRIATASYDQLVRLWNKSGTGTPELFLHASPVRDISFSPDEKLLVTACDDYTTRVWNIERHAEAYPPLRHSSFVVKSQFGPDSGRIATAVNGGIVVVWNLRDAEAQSGDDIACMSPDGSRFAKITQGAVQVYDSKTEKPLALPFSETGTVRDLRFTTDGGRVLIFSDGPTNEANPVVRARLFTATGEPLGVEFPIPGFAPESPTHEASNLSKDGFKVMIATESIARVWDTRLGKVIGPPVEFSTNAGVALSSDGEKAVAYAGTSVFLVNANSGGIIASLPHPARVNHAVFSPDSHLLATACRDDDERPLSAYVWEATSGKKVGPELKHADGIEQTVFSPNGKFLLTVGEDRIIRNWRTDTWQENFHIRGLQPFVAAAFDSDGTRIATVSADDTIRIWTGLDGDRIAIPLTPPLRHMHNLWNVRFLRSSLEIRLLSKRLSYERWALESSREDRGSSRAPHDSARKWEKHIWKATSTPDSIPELRNRCELLSGERIQEQEAVPLSSSEVQERWLIEVNANDRSKNPK